jgi:hypothetical protein
LTQAFGAAFDLLPQLRLRSRYVISLLALDLLPQVWPRTDTLYRFVNGL